MCAAPDFNQGGPGSVQPCLSSDPTNFRAVEQQRLPQVEGYRGNISQANRSGVLIQVNRGASPANSVGLALLNCTTMTVFDGRDSMLLPRNFPGPPTDYRIDYPNIEPRSAASAGAIP